MTKTWIFLLVFIVACAKDGKIDNLLGDWEVHSSHYDCSLRIMTEEGNTKGQLLYYWDGTSRFKTGSGEERYLFENLKSEEDYFVDAYSGATSTEDLGRELRIELVAEDSLLITTYIAKHPLRELWTRKEKKE